MSDWMTYLLGFLNIKSLLLKVQKQYFFGIIYVCSLSRRVCYLSGILKWITFPSKLHVYHNDGHRIEKNIQSSYELHIVQER